MTAKEKFGVMLKYIRFSTRKGENKTLIEIRTGEDCRLDAVIESVSYPFFECAYSLTAEHGEEWLLRIADLHMENWKEVYMPSDTMPDADAENWEVAYCEQDVYKRQELRCRRHFFMLSDQEDIAGYIQGADTWYLWRAVHRELRSHRQSPGVFQSFHVKADCLSVG